MALCSHWLRESFTPLPGQCCIRYVFLAYFVRLFIAFSSRSGEGGAVKMRTRVAETVVQTRLLSEPVCNRAGLFDGLAVSM